MIFSRPTSSASACSFLTSWVIVSILGHNIAFATALNEIKLYEFRNVDKLLEGEALVMTGPIIF